MPCLVKRIGIKSSNLLTETSALLCAAMLKMKAVSILGFLKDSGKIFRNGGCIINLRLTKNDVYPISS